MSSLLNGLAGGVEYSKDAPGKVAFQAALDFFGGFTFDSSLFYVVPGLIFVAHFVDDDHL